MGTMAAMTIEELARTFVDRGWIFSESTFKVREYDLAVLDGLEYAVENGKTVEPELIAEARRLVVDADLAEDIEAAIAQLADHTAA